MFFKLIEERRTRIVSSYNNSQAIGWLKFKTGEGEIIQRRLYQKNNTKEMYYRYKGQLLPHFEY